MDEWIKKLYVYTYAYVHIHICVYIVYIYEIIYIATHTTSLKQRIEWWLSGAGVKGK